MAELWPRIKKRWRAWLRAVHRDFGYLAIGFTVIYATSGIAQNHIEDWGEVSYKSYEKTIHIAAIPDDAPDDVAIKAVLDAAALGTPTSTFRAGDEVRPDESEVVVDAVALRDRVDADHVVVADEEHASFELLPRRYERFGIHMNRSVDGH